jgi:hypothetical protein
MNAKLLDSLVKIIYSLTEEEQAMLQQKLLTASSKKEENYLKNSTSLEAELFVGMWQDRQDLEDSTQWVRHLRQKEWMS